MNKTEETKVNEFDVAHQDVLSVLDELPSIVLDELQVKQIAEHVAGAKDRIYRDHIESAIRELDSLNHEEEHRDEEDTELSMLD